MNSPTPARREQICFRCQAAVIWANLDGGPPVAVERCQRWKGDVAFQLQVGGAEQLVSASGGSWRKHRCPPGAARSFSAAGGRKKERP